MILIIISIVIIGLALYCLRFYPQQSMDCGQRCEITTPEADKYQNDCLHPCVRVLEDGTYILVQSPWPSAKDNVENPIVYRSDNPYSWTNGHVVIDSPDVGYNSDPNIFDDEGQVYVFWREVDTPLCRKRGQRYIVVGGKLNGEGKVPNVQVYFGEAGDELDKTICPVLIKRNGKYCFYTTWYRKKPNRMNLGIAIWEGTSLDAPDFRFIETVGFHNPFVCDKFVQTKVFGYLFFVPMPKRYDLWHFDLFEYNGLLYMVSCAEMDDNIMLSVSRDWKHFKTFKRPLLNTHYSENHVGYRQFFYKPSAQVIDGKVYLWYTSNHSHPYKNELFLTTKKIGWF